MATGNQGERGADTPVDDGAAVIYRGSIGRGRDEEGCAQRARLTFLRAAMTTAVAQTGSLPGILQQCAQAMVDHLDAVFARIWTLNPETNVLELMASAGQYTHLNGSHSRIPVGQLKIVSSRTSGDPI